MKDLMLTSPPVASTWRATNYQLASLELGEPKVVRADPKASWDRVDVFGLFNPSTGEPGPHISFLGLKENNKSLGRFVRKYGLLGLFNETFSGAPILPSRVGPFSWVAPDTVRDEWGRLQSVDPTTEGKELLEAHLGVRLSSVVEPDELRFSSHRLTPFGLIDPVTGAAHSPTLAWEEVRELYGVRIVLDEESASGVSIISTHEPLTFWDLEIKNFPVPPCDAETLNSHTRGATRYAVPDKESGKLRQSWRCSSLLAAMYLMLYLDETGGEFGIKKCQAPGCPEYFRVEVGDRRKEKRIYCPPPTGRRESNCATRVSSAADRERKRRKS